MKKEITFETLVNALTTEMKPGDKSVRRFNTPCQNARSEAGDYPMWELGIYVTWFTVPDTEAGVKAVAMALGNGWGNISPCDECATEYPRFGIVFDEDGAAEFREPVLMVSSETIGYREIGGGIKEAYETTLITLDDYEEDDGESWGVTWTLDVYRLRPGMEDGWALVQSASSSAIVRADKVGSEWTVTLAMPVLPEGRPTGSGYRACFEKARTWYATQSASEGGE